MPHYHTAYQGTAFLPQASGVPRAAIRVASPVVVEAGSWLETVGGSISVLAGSGLVVSLLVASVDSACGRACLVAPPGICRTRNRRGH